MLNLYMLLLPKNYLGWPNINQNNMNHIIINKVYLKEQNFLKSCQMLVVIRDFAC